MKFKPEHWNDSKGEPYYSVIRVTKGSNAGQILCVLTARTVRGSNFEVLLHKVTAAYAMGFADALVRVCKGEVTL